MKFIGPSMKDMGGGTSTHTILNTSGFDIRYGLTRPDDLQNGLWIKNTRELPILEVSDWIRTEFKNNNTVDVTAYNTSYYCNPFLNEANGIKYFAIDDEIVLIFESYIYKYNHTNNYIIGPTGSMSASLSTNIYNMNNYTQYAYYNNYWYTVGNTTYNNYRSIHKFGNKFYLIGGYYTTYSSGSTLNSVSCTDNISIYDYDTNIITSSNMTLYTPSCNYNTLEYTSGNNKFIVLFNGQIATYVYSGTRMVCTTSTNRISIIDPINNIITHYQSTLSVSDFENYYIDDNNILTLAAGMTYNTFNGTVNRNGSGTNSINYGSYTIQNIIYRFDLENKIFTSESIDDSDTINVILTYFSPKKYVTLSNEAYYINNGECKKLDLSSYTYEDIDIDDLFSYQSKYLDGGSTPDISMVSCYNYKYYLTTVSNLGSTILYLYNDELYCIRKYSNLYTKFKFKLGSIQEPFLLNSNVYCYPIVYNKQPKNNELYLSNTNSKYISEIVSSTDNINNNSYSSSYSKSCQIKKIYKPDYSGEEQEAWLVSGGVWTLVGEGQNEESSSFKGRLLNISAIPNSSIDGTQECVWITSNNNLPNIQKYTIGNTTYVYGPNSNSLCIKADLIAGFDDTHTWNNDYASELFKNVKIITNHIYKPNTGSTNISYLPFVSIGTFNNVKYIFINFNTYSKSGSYEGTYLISLEVYV